MELIILTIMVISLVTVFAVDTVQKRPRYIGENS